MPTTTTGARMNVRNRFFSKQANYTKQIRAEESYLNNRFQGNLSTQNVRLSFDPLVYVVAKKETRLPFLS